jgi:uncharacterized protein YdgA (DUF945 family)
VDLSIQEIVNPSKSVRIENLKAHSKEKEKEKEKNRVGKHTQKKKRYG